MFFYNEKKYQNMKLEGKYLEEFKRETGLEQCPSWGFNIVKSIYQIENNYFYLQQKPEEKDGIIEMAKIVGSTYWDDYRTKPWWFFRITLRRNNIKTLTQANDAIDNPKKEDEPYYMKIGNEFFISSGHHRTCIAKFGGRKEIYASYREFYFDHELFNYYSFLNDYFDVNLNNKNTYVTPKQLPEPIWDLERNNFKISLYGRQQIINYVRYFKELKHKPLNFKLFRLLNKKSFYKKYKTYAWHYNNNEFDKDMIRYKSMLVKYNNI